MDVLWLYEMPLATVHDELRPSQCQSYMNSLTLNVIIALQLIVMQLLWGLFEPRYLYSSIPWKMYNVQRSSIGTSSDLWRDGVLSPGRVYQSQQPISAYHRLDVEIQNFIIHVVLTSPNVHNCCFKISRCYFFNNYNLWADVARNFHNMLDCTNPVIRAIPNVR